MKDAISVCLNEDKIYEGGEYGSIGSEFIKKQIKGRKWKDREYINDLLSLERWLIDQPRQGQSWGLFNELRRKYKKEFQILLKEIKPKWWKECLKNEKESKKGEKEFNEQLKEGEQENEKNWIKLGGKL